ncbi:hypothetical protein Tco_1439692 [Tanacetum coccineum]
MKRASKGYSEKVKSLESELHQTKQTYSTAITKLINRVKKLEHTIKTSQARRIFKAVLSDDEEEAKDPYKQGRKISDIDKDPTISLVVLEEEEPTELVEDQGSGKKGEKKVSTIGAEHSTAIPEVSTAAANLVYIRRSAKKRKDKEIARQLQEKINIAGQEKVVTEDDLLHLMILTGMILLYDLVKLWELIKERFNTTEPIDDKEGELWVELKRLFKPDTDELMEL